ncbi:hypothetical protein [Candidatus Tisiphia endosymbiont of Beris chalybata]|uniref:hypothetical protein n=1 Tax=Candidatus Tisiphia endosymbiont of Beris chalybata TaxID=3066262 RepID=UPI00312C7867
MNTEPIFVKRPHTQQNDNELIVNKKQKTVRAEKQDVRVGALQYCQMPQGISQDRQSNVHYEVDTDRSFSKFYVLSSSNQQSIARELQTARPFWESNSLEQSSFLELPIPQIVVREVQEAFTKLQQKFRLGQTVHELEPTFIAIISDDSVIQLKYIDFFLNNDPALRVLQALECIFGNAFLPNLVWISYIIRCENNIIEVFQELCAQLFYLNEADNTYCQDQEGNYFFTEEINLLFHHLSLPEIAIICHSGEGAINIHIIKTLCRFYVKAQLIENDLGKCSRGKSAEMQESWNELTHLLKHAQHIEVKKVEPFIEYLKGRYLSILHCSSSNISGVQLVEHLEHNRENTDKVTPTDVNIEIPTINDKSPTKCSAIIVNSGEFGARSDGATPIYNRQALSDDVTNFSSVDYSKTTKVIGRSRTVEKDIRERASLEIWNHEQQQASLANNYDSSGVCHSKINQHIFAIVQRRFKLEQTSQQLKCDFITTISPKERTQKPYMQFFIKNKSALKALKTLEYKFEAELNDNLVSISSIIKNGTRTSAVFEALCQYLFERNETGAYQQDHKGNYIFKGESNFLLKYISFHEIATICCPGAGRKNLQILQKLGEFYAKAQVPEQDVGDHMLIEVENVRASLGELQETLIEILPSKYQHKIYNLINKLTTKYDAIIQDNSDNNITSSNLAIPHHYKNSEEEIGNPEITALREILLVREEANLIGVEMS